MFGPVGALPPEVVRALTSYVHRDDLVPRMCVASVQDLLRLLAAIHARFPNWVDKSLGTLDLTPVLLTADPTGGWLRQLLARSDVSALMEVYGLGAAAGGADAALPPLLDGVSHEDPAAPLLRIPGAIYCIRDARGAAAAAAPADNSPAAAPRASALAALLPSASTTRWVASIAEKGQDTLQDQWSAAASALKATFDRAGVALPFDIPAQAPDALGSLAVAAAAAAAEAEAAAVAAAAPAPPQTFAADMDTRDLEALVATPPPRADPAAIRALPRHRAFVTAATPDDFTHLSVSDSAVTDHLMASYLVALRDLCAVADGQLAAVGTSPDFDLEF